MSSDNTREYLKYVREKYWQNYHTFYNKGKRGQILAGYIERKMDRDDGAGENLSPIVKLRLRKKLVGLLNLYVSLYKGMYRDKWLLEKIKELRGYEIKYLRNLIKPNQAVKHLKQQENGNS